MILLHGHKTGTARQKEAGVPACNYRDALAEPGVGAPAPSKAAPDHRSWKAADSLEKLGCPWAVDVYTLYIAILTFKVEMSPLSLREAWRIRQST